MIVSNRILFFCSLLRPSPFSHPGPFCRPPSLSASPSSSGRREALQAGCGRGPRLAGRRGRRIRSVCVCPRERGADRAGGLGPSRSGGPRRFATRRGEDGPPPDAGSGGAAAAPLAQEGPRAGGRPGAAAGPASEGPPRCFGRRRGRVVRRQQHRHRWPPAVRLWGRTAGRAGGEPRGGNGPGAAGG